MTDVKRNASSFVPKQNFCSSRSSDVSSSPSDIKPDPHIGSTEGEDALVWSSELVDLVMENLGLARQRIFIYSSELPTQLASVRTLFSLLTNVSRNWRSTRTERAAIEDSKDRKASFETCDVDSLSHEELLKVIMHAYH